MNASATDFQRRIGRIETLIEEIERFADPAARDATREIVQVLLEFHGTALASLMGHIATAGPPGQAILDTLAQDDLVAHLLLLHSLHPEDLATRVSQALDQVRPQLATHGGDVTLLSVKGGVVRLRMQGSCHGCPSSAATLKHTIETAVYNAAPDVTSIEVEGAEPAAPHSFLPIVTLGPSDLSRVAEEG